MKILVIQQKRIGDVLVGTSICNNLRKRFPEAEIHYMIYHFTRDVVKHNPNIDKAVWFADRYRNPVNLLGLVTQVRRERYDILIDAYEKLETWVIARLSSVPIRISYKKPYRQYIYNRLEEVVKEPQTAAGMAIENRLALLRSLHASKVTPDSEPKIFLNRAERQWAKNQLEKMGIDERQPLLMVGVLGSVPDKTWPLEFMRVAIERLLARGIQLAFSYFPHQREEVWCFYKSLKDKQGAFFQLRFENLRQMSALVERCAVYLGNDCGYPHIAKAVGTPTVTLFAPFVQKDHWSTFEDGVQNLGIHLVDFEPDVIEKRTLGPLRKRYRDYYRRLTPDRVWEKAWPFIERQLQKNNRKGLTFAWN